MTKPLSDGELALGRLRLQHQMQALVMREFLFLERTAGFTIAALAARIGRPTAWARDYLDGSKSYNRLDDFSDMVLAMGCEPRISCVPLYPVPVWTRAWYWWRFKVVPAIRAWNPCNA